MSLRRVLRKTVAVSVGRGSAQADHVRGACATPAASPEGQGSGAPSRGRAARRGLLGLVCLCLLGLAALLGSAPAAIAAEGCSNAAFRTGPSANLPDCRAYELVTPPDTNSATPLSPIFQGDNFNTPAAAPSGNSYLYRIEGTLVPGTEGGGYQNEYQAARGAGGWSTSLVGPTGAQATTPDPGGATPNHNYQIFGVSHFSVKPGGSLDIGVEHRLSYVRYPDGSFHLLGEGTLPANPDTDGYQNGLADDPAAVATWIAPNGSHIIFYTGAYSGTTPVQLLADAPPTGTRAVYDRTPTGLHVVSLLPGNVTPSAGETANAQGASVDGTAVAFTIEHELPTKLLYYVRRNNDTTILVPDAATGETLTCAGGPGSATLGYEWLRNGAPIAGQTGPTYTTTAADEGVVVQCRVTAANSEGASRTASPPQMVEPIGSAVPPSFPFASSSGPATVGSTLTCNPGTWGGGPSFAYRWLRNGAPISGATSSTYNLVGADNETAIQCEVTGTNAGGAAVADSARTVIRSEPPVNTGSTANAPAVTGTATAGSTLTCANGAWTGASSFAYQWLRNGAEIAGATSNTYTLVTADEGKAIQCRVTAVNAGGSGVATSANTVVAPAPSPLPPTRPSSAISVSGTRTVGQILTCSHGSWGNTPTAYEYQWLRNGAPIAGANSGATTVASYTYTTVSADLDKLIQCRITATNAGGSSGATSPSTQANVIVVKPPSATASTGSTIKTYAGFSEDGSRLFYLQGGDVFSFDTSTGRTSRLTSAGDAAVANVSADGSHVYFVSHHEINGEGSAGQPNLYVSDGSAVRFIATVEEADLFHSANFSYGLAAWANPGAVFEPGEALPRAQGMNFLTETSRTTPDGTVFAFETTAKLTSYENKGHTEVYRYDTEAAPGERLTCVSCNPSGAPAGSDAQLADSHSAEGLDVNSVIPSLTADGAAVFFESAEALVPGDSNGVTDVYEWREGRISLVSSGHSALPSILTGMTPDGHDVFFQTNESLVPNGQVPGVGAIYDARVGGGLASQNQIPTVPCVDEACQGSPPTPPGATVPASLVFSGLGNLPAPVASRPVVKSLTNAQKLARALKACKKRRKGQRGKCESQAHKRYGKKASKSGRSK